MNSATSDNIIPSDFMQSWPRPIKEFFPACRREPVRAEEAEILRKLGQSITSISSRFCSTGYLKKPHKNCAILYPATREEPKLSKARLLSLSAGGDEYAKLHEFSLPSSHGIGGKTVYDESYRLARELKPEEFALNFDPLEPLNGLIETISKLCEVDVYATLHKLNTYAQGGFFRPHQDTPKSEEHIGTLVIGLPSPFEGGQFVLRHSGKEVILDWSTSSRQASQENGLQWVFFFSDVEHEILPVTSGYRLTLSYDVFKLSSAAPAGAIGLDVKHSRVYVDLNAALHNSSILPNGGSLAFGLQHDYPVRTSEWVKNPIRHLKGPDLVLQEILKALHLEAELKAVYCVSLYDWLVHLQETLAANLGSDEEGSKSPLPNVDFIDEFGSRTRSENDSEFFLLSDYFGGIPENTLLNYEEGDMSANAWLIGVAKAVFDQEIIWASKPFGRSVASTFGAYGNEWITTHCYVSAALVVKIASYGDRKNKG